MNDLSAIPMWFAIPLIIVLWSLAIFMLLRTNKRKYRMTYVQTPKNTEPAFLVNDIKNIRRNVRQFTKENK